MRDPGPLFSPYLDWGSPSAVDQFFKTRSEVPISKLESVLSVNYSTNKLFIVHVVNNQRLAGFSLSGYEFNYQLQLHFKLES